MSLARRWACGALVAVLLLLSGALSHGEEGPVVATRRKAPHVEKEESDGLTAAERAAETRDEEGVDEDDTADPNSHPRHIRGGFQQMLYACYPRYTSCFNSTAPEKRQKPGCDDKRVPISELNPAQQLREQLQYLREKTADRVFDKHHSRDQTLKFIITGSEWNVRAPLHSEQYTENDYKEYIRAIGSVVAELPPSYIIVPGTFMWSMREKGQQLDYMFNCAPVFHGGRAKPVTQFCKEGQDDELDDNMLWAADADQLSAVGKRWRHFYRTSTPRIVEGRAMAVDICADYVTESGPATRVGESIRTEGRLLDIFAVISNNMQLHHAEGRINENKLNPGAVAMICDGHQELSGAKLDFSNVRYPAAAVWQANAEGKVVSHQNDERNHTVPLPGANQQLSRIGTSNVRGQGEQVWYYTAAPIRLSRFSVRRYHSRVHVRSLQSQQALQQSSTTTVTVSQSPKPPAQTPKPSTQTPKPATQTPKPSQQSPKPSPTNSTVRL